MARLIDRFTRSNLPDPEQITLMSSTWPTVGATEQILRTFRSYAAFGYGANSAVFAVTNARMMPLSQAKFKWRDKTTGKLFGDPTLAVLESPWPNGTTSDLIANMEQHGSIAGNAFVRLTDNNRLVVMRPDWVDIVNVVVHDGYDPEGNETSHVEPLGYLYSEGGYGVTPAVFYDVAEVAHYAPIPDPMAQWRGMSWMTPILREINADVSMTQHRQVFFDQAGTPNLILKYAQKLQPQTLETIRDRWRSRFGGPQGAGSTVVLDEGGDLTVVGSTFESMKFTELQSAGEARIAAAAGVPPIVANLSAGLDASTYSNYKEARQAFAASTLTSLWNSMSQALSTLITAPNSGCELAVDTSNVAMLREDEADRAANMQTHAATASTLLAAGYTPDSITTYLQTGDLGQLTHSGLVSVQLYKAEAKTAPSIPSKDKIEPPAVAVGPPVRSEVLLEALVARAAAEDTRRPAPATVTIEAGAIQAHMHAAPTEVRNEFTLPETTIHIEAAPAPQVTVENHVEPTPVRVDVAAPPAPVAPDVHVYPTVAVDLPARKTVTQVERDKAGLIRKTTSTETDA